MTKVTGQPKGENADLNNYIADTTPAPAGAPASTPAPSPEPTLDLPAQGQDKPVPNLAQLGDGTTLDLNEMLLGPTERPGEPVHAQTDGQMHEKLADLFDSLNSSAPNAEIASLAALARQLEL